LVAGDGIAGNQFGFSLDVNGSRPIIDALGHATTAGFALDRRIVIRSKPTNRS
jgi:hypothetical protein